MASASSGEPTAVLVHGFEAMPRAEVHRFFRRSNFMRGRLARAGQTVLVIVEADTWSWLVKEVPDLVRWADGPFLLPALAHGPHPLAGLRALRVEFGQPTPTGLDCPLDEHRGVDPVAGALEAIKRGRSVLLGGPPGVGVRHTAVRVERHLSKAGMTVTWPPNTVMLNGRAAVGTRRTVSDPDVPFGKSLDAPRPFGSWAREQHADVIVVPRPFAEGAAQVIAELGKRALILTSTSDVHARTTSSSFEPVYVPPVRVERAIEPAPETPFEPGMDSLRNALQERARAAGSSIDAALTSDARDFLIWASGGIPGVLWVLAEETSRRAALSEALPATLESARLVAADIGNAWEAGFRRRKVSGRTRRRTLRDRRENEGIVEILYVSKSVTRVLHPLIRMAGESAFAPGFAGEPSFEWQD